MTVNAQAYHWPKKKRRGMNTPGVMADPVMPEPVRKPTSSPKSVDTAPEPPSEISKREKRRAREAKKKEEQEAEKLATKAAKKLAKGGGAPRDTSAQQEAKLNRKADGVKPNPKPKRTPPLVAEADVFSEHKVNAAVANVSEKRTKMKEKWGESWTGWSLVWCN